MMISQAICGLLRLNTVHFYIACDFAGTQWPRTQIYPAGQSESMEHVKSWSACLKPDRCLLWRSATPAPTQMSKGAMSPASNANIQLRKPLIFFPPPSPDIPSTNWRAGTEESTDSNPPERHTVPPYIARKHN